MELFEQYGFTQTMLQGAIIIIATIVFFGMFWRYIVIGAGILFVVFVFGYKPSVAKIQSPAQPVEVVKQIGRAHV